MGPPLRRHRNRWFKNKGDKDDKQKEQQVENPHKVKEENDGDNGATSHENGMEIYDNFVTKETTWENQAIFWSDDEDNNSNSSHDKTTFHA